MVLDELDSGVIIFSEQDENVTLKFTNKKVNQLLGEDLTDFNAEQLQ